MYVLQNIYGVYCCECISWIFYVHSKLKIREKLNCLWIAKINKYKKQQQQQHRTYTLDVIAWFNGGKFELFEIKAI